MQTGDLIHECVCFSVILHWTALSWINEPCSSSYRLQGVDGEILCIFHHVIVYLPFSLSLVRVVSWVVCCSLIIGWDLWARASGWYIVPCGASKPPSADRRSACREWKLLLRHCFCSQNQVPRQLNRRIPVWNYSYQVSTWTLPVHLLWKHYIFEFDLWLFLTHHSTCSCW